MLKKITILLFLLTFPSVLYVILTTGKTNFIHLPYFGERKLAPNGKDTIYHSIPQFNLINQNGDSITNKNYDGKIYVASYFYTDCNTIVCQKVTTELLRVQEKFMYINDKVKILSFTMKPEKDSIKELKKYSSLVHAETIMWNFVTGDANQISNLATNGFLLSHSIGNNKITDSLYNERLVLVDKERHIRGFYDGTDIKQVNNLLDDIKVLLAEYYIKENEKKK